MTTPHTPATAPPSAKDDKKERLSKALRANLQRRKSTENVRKEKEWPPSS